MLHSSALSYYLKPPYILTLYRIIELKEYLINEPVDVLKLVKMF